MPPEAACVPQSIPLRCMNKYVVVVRTALYGVAQTPGQCAYKPGDCVADAMSIAICIGDAIQCSIYGVRKKLPQCNDQYSSYVHIEYDCVPIEMDNSSKEYNVCQNGTDITTDHGIIKSPGYPSPFQTTTWECFSAIHVPDDKTIRLWLSDLYIGSTGTNCASDHVYVVDSVQTYKHCGLQRYVYPYLCSSTIIIQYLATSNFATYKGMRMYFEIIDRPEIDYCPQVSVTPVPSTTTTASTIRPISSTLQPPYVTLGIASPIRSFQICKGESHIIECPNNYAVTVITNIFGVTTSGQCEPHDSDKHCVVTTTPTFACRESCTYMYTGHEVVQSCNNKIADYQYVEYQCIPIKSNIISPSTQCPNNGSKTLISIDRNGRFQSFDYPNLRAMNCTYRLKTKPGYIMHIYSLEISLNNFLPNCTSNKMSLIEDNEELGLDICEQRTYSLIYSSCSNELDLQYIITDDTQIYSHGIELYIESQARSSDWSCGKPSLTTANPPTIRTTPFTIPTATPLINDSIVGALAEEEYDICAGNSAVKNCPTGYTFMILDAYYGVKSQSTNKCGFTQGDCVHETTSSIAHCRNDAPSCYLPYSIKVRLPQCSDNFADYLHVTYQCVPSKPVGPTSTLNVYNICDTTNPILDLNGIVTSPGFPTYRQTNTECKRVITGVQDRVLKIWINEMAVLSGGQRHLDDEPDVIIHKTHDTNDLDKIEQMYPSIRDNCITDYLIINTPHLAYVYCGTRKLAIAPICATGVTIQYRANSTSSIFYKGFKFYFEWVEKPMDIFCDGMTPTFDPLASTTTPVDEPWPVWAQNLDLSPRFAKHVCLGNMESMRCPRSNDYVLSIVDSSYGVTGTGLCEVPSPTHCFQEAALGLTCTHSCSFEYIIPKLLSQCGNQTGDYIMIHYECIPTRLSNNENPIDICASTGTDTIALDKGMITSPQYPSLATSYSCSNTIETLSNKLWMIYIVDLFMEGENDFGQCNDASLTIYDGNYKLTYCGLQPPGLVLFSCSNIVQFSFTSSRPALGSFRGFKVFFKTINIPIGWPCANSTVITTVRPSPPTTLEPPTLQVAAYGGTTINGKRQYCKFPFIYESKQQESCIFSTPPSSPSHQNETDPWCSLTSNFDTDQQWGFCDIGVTDPTFVDICQNQIKSLVCSPGYIINIITAKYAAKPVGNTGTSSCNYDQNDCFQSYTSTINNICAGKTLCTPYYESKSLVSCQNRPSAYLRIGYSCVPDDIRNITTYDMCNNNLKPQIGTRRGFLISPNFPDTQNNIDCTYDLQIVKPNQDIYLYIIDMDLNSPNSIGQRCTKDRLIVTADDSFSEWCERSYTNLLLKTCHTSVSLQLIRASDAVGLGVRFYFEFRERLPEEVCEEIDKFTTRPTLSPTPAVSTTISPLPNYFPDPSPRILGTLCFPDISALFGANNFRCPQDYVMVIHRAFYGKGDQCDYIPGDCTSEADNVYRTCSGKQSCSVSFLNTVTLPECNNDIATYLFLEYQCLPTLTIAQNVNDLCTIQNNELFGISGILRSSSYPIYTQKECKNITLSSLEGSNLVIYMYLLDLYIGQPDVITGKCSDDDYLLLSYQCNNQLHNERLCGAHSTEISFSTCSPTDKIFISYKLSSSDSASYRGFALLYHLLPKFGTSTSTVTTSLSTKTTPTPIVGPGPMSTMIAQSIVCVEETMQLRCDSDYILVLHKIDLAVSRTGKCIYSSDDCFEERTHLYGTCAGTSSCDILAPLVPLSKCNNSNADYFYAEYQCIPTRPKLNVDVCSPLNPLERVVGGAIVSSMGYTSSNTECKVMLQAAKLLGNQAYKAFAVYISMLNLPIRSNREQGAQCSDNDPYIEIEDTQTGITRLCGNSHTRKLFETCSDTVQIRYKNFNIITNDAPYKGFQLYFESIEKNECSTEIVTIVPPKPREPFVITEEIACALSIGRERVSFACPPNHGLVFLQSNEFVTTNPQSCDITQQTCHYQSEQPQALCSGQQSCSYVHSISNNSQLNICQGNKGDLLQFFYQCIPMKPSVTYLKATFCIDKIVTMERGFIETSAYPEPHHTGQEQCSLRISLPDHLKNKQLTIFLYIIELSLRDTSIIDPSSSITCYDSITYNDGDTTGSLCGSIDQPVLVYQTKKSELELILNINETLPANETNIWHGARLFYYIGNQSLPLPSISTTSVTMTTTTTTVTTTTKAVIDETTNHPGDKPNHAPTIAGAVIGGLVVLFVLIGLIFYRRRLRAKAFEAPKVRYRTGEDTINGDMSNGRNEKRSSIPPAALKGPASSTFTSPFYKPQDIENQTDA